MFDILFNLWKLISRKRRLQALLIIALAVIASISEIFTLSSFILMLNFIINPEAELALSINNINIISNIFEDMKKNSILFFGLFIFCVLVSGSLRLMLLWATLRYSFRTGSDFARSIFYNTLKQPLEYHLKTSSNEILNSLTKKIYLICFEILIPFIVFFSNIIIILSVTVFIIFIIGILNAFLMIGIIVVTYFVIWLFSKRIINVNSLLIARDTDKLVTFTLESFSVIRLILLKDIQLKFSNKFDLLNRNIKLAESTNLFLAQGTRILIESIFLVSIAIISIIAFTNTNFNTILPIIGAFGLALLRILPLVQRTYQGYVTLRGAYYSFFDLLVYLKLPVEKEKNLIHKSKILLSKSIRLENICYKYKDSDKNILNSLNLTIPANKMTVIKGFTGSGKTTLVSIIMGLIKPSKGSIYIDKIKLKNSNSKQWQHLISYMPQDTVILDTSLETNLKFLSSVDFNIEILEKYLRLTKLNSFIDKYLNKPKKNLGEKGDNLSGGEKQRIGLSRTLIENKPVVILDEPSSSLDKRTTNSIFSELQQKSDRTIIIISHDPEISKYADLIIDLNKIKD